MIVLAIDTCDSRGSVAVLKGDAVVGSATHETAEDYSSWLLPAVEGVLRGSGIRIADVDLYAAASGPGSFTGVRVGLTTVKAWAEVYQKRVIAASRLEAIAVQNTAAATYVAGFADAQRGQVFGALYRPSKAGLERLGDEMVLAPGKFVEWVEGAIGEERASWVSPDATQVLAEAAWIRRRERGESIELVSAMLAPGVGRLGARKLAEGQFTDALGLDANYVRRSDAEIFWKSRPAHGG